MFTNTKFTNVRYKELFFLYFVSVVILKNNWLIDKKITTEDGKNGKKITLYFIQQGNYENELLIDSNRNPALNLYAELGECNLKSALPSLDKTNKILNQIRK